MPISEDTTKAPERDTRAHSRANSTLESDYDRDDFEPLLQSHAHEIATTTGDYSDANIRANVWEKIRASSTERWTLRPLSQSSVALEDIAPEGDEIAIPKDLVTDGVAGITEFGAILDRVIATAVDPPSQPYDDIDLRQRFVKTLGANFHYDILGGWYEFDSGVFRPADDLLSIYDLALRFCKPMESGAFGLTRC